MDELTQMANDLEVGRYAFSLESSQISDAEDSLRRNPADLALRARLLRYYSGEMLTTEKLNHIDWFVSNIPDSRFCGESVFYVGRDEHGYSDLANLWIEQTKQSDSLMRRINAYLFLMNGEDDANLERYFDRFFSQHLNNIWVKSVSNPEDWFEEASAEILNKVAMSQTRLARASYEYVDNATLRRTAVNAANRGTSELAFWNQLEVFRTNQDLSSLAFVIGYTAGRCQVDSRIGFSPDIAISRFEVMSWMISNIPNLPFAGSPFALIPFQNDWKPTPVIRLNDYLSYLWEEQLKDIQDVQVIENAVNFAVNLQIANLPVAEKLMDKIQSTPVGTEILNRVTSGLDR